jgi:hypothetical protein
MRSVGKRPKLCERLSLGKDLLCKARFDLMYARIDGRNDAQEIGGTRCPFQTATFAASEKLKIEAGALGARALKLKQLRFVMSAMHVHDGCGKAGNASTKRTIIREICECN